MEGMEDKTPCYMGWLKKIGIAGFLFFLVKGLVWLGVFIWAGKCAMD